MTDRRSRDAAASRDTDPAQGPDPAHSPDPVRDGHRVWSAPIAFAVVVFVASIVPIPGGSGGGDTTGLAWLGPTAVFHVFGYAVLAALLARGAIHAAPGSITRNGRPGTSWRRPEISSIGPHTRRLLAAVVVASLFGFGIEVVQLAVPWRTFAWVDVGLNTVGAAIGVTGWVVGRRLIDRDAPVSH